MNGGGANVALYAVIGVPFVVLLWVVGTVNRFVKVKNHIRESWANVDVALKRRYDLIPNLVETCKAMAAHERNLFEKVASLRQHAMGFQGTVGMLAQEQNELVRATNQLLARVEAYPQLIASTTFLELQHELANTEDRIAAARRFYNANVRDFNTLLESFPSGMIGRMAGHREQDLFEVEDLSVREPVRVEL